MKYKMDIQYATENKENRDMVVNYWLLGPEIASNDPKANKDYWTKFAKVIGVEESEARRRLCANCEYFNNTRDMISQMEAIPLDKYDMDGGGRGYCHKFDFICHNLRTCQAWEDKYFYLKDNENIMEEI